MDNFNCKSYGRINAFGLWSLYKKECARFFVVFVQTILSPIVSTLIFLGLFIFIQPDKKINGIEYVEFIVPGLIIMSIIQNSFANTSSSLIISKMQKTMDNLLMVPLTAIEIIIAYCAAGITRGILVGFSSWLVLFLMYGTGVYSIPITILYTILGAGILSSLGIIAGILCKKFEQMSFVTIFIITPLSFLSGTFYSIKQLPPLLYEISLYNPFFYMIDGFRFGIIGVNDESIIIGSAVLIITNISLFLISWVIIKKGYGFQE